MTAKEARIKAEMTGTDIFQVKRAEVPRKGYRYVNSLSKINEVD